MTGVKVGAALIALALGLAAGSSDGATRPSGLQFDRDGHAWLMNANGSDQRVSPLHHYGTWSANGARVAYATQTGGYVAKGDGSDPRRVARLPADDNCFVPDWSPNAEQLAFVTGCIDATNLVVERADFTNRRHLAKGLSRTLRPRWSPDGSTILFAGRAPGQNFFAFYVIRPDGDKPQRIPGFTFHLKYGGDWDWSRDGQTIFALLETQDKNLGLELLAVDRRGGKARLLTPPKLNVDAFDLSPDGTRIALQAAPRSHGYSDIYVMRTDGTLLRQLTHKGANDTSPTWSPRGDKIAFVRDWYGNAPADIYVMNADGSAQTNLTHNPAWDDAPSWIP